MTLKRYLQIGMIGTAILIVVMCTCLAFVAKSMMDLRSDLLEQAEIEVLQKGLEGESIYLTSQVRIYALTQNERFLTNYNTALEANLFAQVNERITKMGAPVHITEQLSAIDKASLALADDEIRAIELVQAGQQEQAKEMLFNDVYEQEAEAIEEQLATFKQSVKEWTTQNISNVSIQAQIMILILSIVALLYFVGIAFLLWRIRSKLSTLFKMKKNATQIAQGDLMVEPIAVDETKQDEVTVLTMAFNTMMDSLQRVIKTVNRTSTEVAAASEQLLSNAEQTNYASEQVAEAVERVSQKSEQQQLQMDDSANALSEMTVGIQQVAQSAEDASEISQETRERAQNGQQEMHKTVSEMEHVELAVDDMVLSIHSLVAHSNKIEAFISAITDISAQTNLLALNASIEAARAGEAGKGFAVVAEEVRKLAEQSNISAQQITDIIGDLQREMHETAQRMEQIVQRVKNGVVSVSQAGSLFETISTSTNMLSDQITGVSAIAQQMAASTEQVLQIFGELQVAAVETTNETQNSVGLVEEQYASMQEITASAEILTNLAGELSNEVSQFRV